jgi:hypothetical protein
MAEEFTPTERRILAVLADGLPHPRKEIIACMEDPLAQAKSIHKHLGSLKIKLRYRGQEILCQLIGKCLFYRQIRHLHSPYDGYR